MPPLRRVINAWGTATPFGVSRSDPRVAQAVADMLQRYVVMSELQAEAGDAIARWSGAPAACVTHCCAAAVTLSIAACMAGSDAGRIARLPDASAMKNRVLMLDAHRVRYGQPIEQAVRLAGAQVVACETLDHLRDALGNAQTACVLAVESHLAPGSGPELTRQLVALAHAAGVPLVLDGAAQDGRVAELVTSGADLALLSAQKYLAAPTAGLVLGREDLVAAVDAQHGGIGRAMKPSKEAMAGVIAALELRTQMPPGAWRTAQQAKVDRVERAAMQWRGVAVQREPDPQGNGFDRLWLSIDSAVAGIDAAALAQGLRDGDPAVAVAPHRLAQGQIGLELTGVAEDELGELCELLAATFSRP